MPHADDDRLWNVVTYDHHWSVYRFQYQWLESELHCLFESMKVNQITYNSVGRCNVLPDLSSIFASTISKLCNFEHSSLQTAAEPISNAAFSAASDVEWTVIRSALGICSDNHFCVSPNPCGWLYTFLMSSILLFDKRCWWIGR